MLFYASLTLLQKLLLSPEVRRRSSPLCYSTYGGGKKVLFTNLAVVKVKETVSFSIQDLNGRHIGLVFFIRKAPGNPPLFD